MGELFDHMTYTFCCHRNQVSLRGLKAVSIGSLYSAETQRNALTAPLRWLLIVLGLQPASRRVTLP